MRLEACQFFFVDTTNVSKGDLPKLALPALPFSLQQQSVESEQPWYKPAYTIDDLGSDK